jgi:malate-CoA ligase subunit beta
MNIHEYQAKAILGGYGLPLGQGGLAYSPEQAAYRTREIGGEKEVVSSIIWLMSWWQCKDRITIHHQPPQT